MDKRKDEEVFADNTESSTKSYKKWRIYKKPKIKKTFISRGQQYEQLDAESDHQPVRRSSTSLIEGSSATGCVTKIVGSLENLQSNKSTSCESIFADQMPSSREINESNKIRFHVHDGGQLGQPFQRRRVVVQRRYRESAIDVPQDFEEAAYAKRVSLPAPKRRNRFSRQCKSQEDWPKIDEEAIESEIQQIPAEIHSYDALESSTHPFQGSFNAQLSRLTSSVENLCAMGNVKAKHGTVFGRSDAVAPAISVPELRESPEEAHFIRVKSCDEPREMLPQRDDEKSATALRNNNRNSMSQDLYSNTEHSSTIDLNSILHRNSEFFITKSSSSKNFLYSSVDKLDKIESINENLASAAAHNVNKLNFNKNTFFLKKLNNSAVAPVEDSGTKTFNKVNLRPKNATGRNCESLKSRFSGSFQNLFRLSDFKVRKRCCSEVNLSSKPVNRDSQPRSFFCPSMIFPRDEDNGVSPKTGPKSWRKYLTLGVFKKKSGGSQ